MPCRCNRLLLCKVVADGHTLAVVSRFEDSNVVGVDGNQANNSAADAGAVYVFVRDVGMWAQQAYLKASNTDDGDQFGTGVALSADGNYLLAGAVGERSLSAGLDGVQTDNTAPVGLGAAYLFQRSAGTRSQIRYIKSVLPAVPQTSPKTSRCPGMRAPSLSARGLETMPQRE